MRTANYPDVNVLAMKIKPELLRTLAALSQHRQAEVLDFARFLGQRGEQVIPAAAPGDLRPAPADTLRQLTGLVALGGDALDDSEAPDAATVSERLRWEASVQQALRALVGVHDNASRDAIPSASEIRDQMRGYLPYTTSLSEQVIREREERP